VKPLRFLLSLCALAGLSAFAAETAGTRADALGIDGIYKGTMGMQLDIKKGREFKAPAQLVLMPAGNEALLSAQHPTGVVVAVMRGQIRGRTFYGESKGREDFGGFQYGMAWDIAFDPKAGTATIHGKAKNRPKWAFDDDFKYTFHKVSGKTPKSRPK
jgi:hypothetical protein